MTKQEWLGELFQIRVHCFLNGGPHSLPTRAMARSTPATHYSQSTIADTELTAKVQQSVAHFVSRYAQNILH